MALRFVRYGLLAALAFTTACLESDRTKDLVGADTVAKVKEGMTADEAVAVLGEGKLTPHQKADSLRLFRGFRNQAYFVNGVRYQVIWYREKPGSIEENITRENETPILLQEGKVIGSGWKFYDAKATEVGLPNPLRAQERLDSIAKSQTPQG